MFHTNPKSAASERRAQIRKALREKYRNKFGPEWFLNAAAKAAYEKEASKKQVLPADMFAHLGVEPSTKRKSKGRSSKARTASRQRDAKGRFMNPMHGLAVSDFGDFDDFDLL